MLAEKIQPSENSTVGQLLKAARLSQALTLEVVAKELHISKRHLVQLEEDNEDLVCDVYTLGFLRSYAHFLGLDEKDLSAKFKNQASHPISPQLPFPAPLPGKGMPSFRIIGFSLFILVSIVIAWEWHRYSESPEAPHEAEWIKSLQTPPVNVEAHLPPQDLPLPESPPLVTPAAEEIQSDKKVAPPPQTTLGHQSVILKATEEVWIEIKNNEGDVIISRLFKPDESYEIKDPHNLFLKTGNARGMQLISGDRSLTFPKNMGMVISNIPLDPEKWVDQRPETH